MDKKVQDKITDEYKYSIAGPRDTKERCFMMILDAVLNDQGKELSELMAYWEKRDDVWYYSVHLKTRRKRGTKV